MSKTFKQRVHEFEAKIIIEALQENNGNRTRAAQTLGMSKFSLARKCKKYGIPDGKPGRPAFEYVVPE